MTSHVASQCRTVHKGSLALATFVRSLPSVNSCVHLRMERRKMMMMVMVMVCTLRWYDRENVLLQVRQGNGRSSEWEAECSSNFERQLKLLLQTEQMNSLLECSSLKAQYWKIKHRDKRLPIYLTWSRRHCLFGAEYGHWPQLKTNPSRDLMSIWCIKRLQNKVKI